MPTFIQLSMDKFRDGRIGEFLTALKRNPDDQAIYIRLGQIYLELYGKSQKLKDWEAAVEYFREGESKGAFSGLGYVVLAAELSRRGSPGEVEVIYDRAINRFLECVEANPFGRDDYVNSLGVLYLLLKQEEEAGGGRSALLARIPEKLTHMLEEMRSRNLDPWFVAREGSVKEERRRYIRVRPGADLKSKLSLGNAPGSPELPVRVVDIGEKGFLVSADKAPEAGAKVSLTLQWPGLTQPLKLDGVVRWMKGSEGAGRFGIELQKVPVDNRKILWAYVRQRLSEEGRSSSSGAA